LDTEPRIGRFWNGNLSCRGPVNAVVRQKGFTRAKVTEGILINVEYGSIKTKETIDKKVVMDSDREYSLVTLDTGDKFHLSGKSGHELEAVGIGSKLKVTQDDGTIIIETV
jgi:hypothetical protein